MRIKQINSGAAPLAPVFLNVISASVNLRAQPATSLGKGVVENGNSR